MATIDLKDFEPRQDIHDQSTLDEVHKSSFLQAFGVLVSGASRSLDSQGGFTGFFLGRL